MLSQRHAIDPSHMGNFAQSSVCAFHSAGSNRRCHKIFSVHSRCWPQHPTRIAQRLKKHHPVGWRRWRFKILNIKDIDELAKVSTPTSRSCWDQQEVSRQWANNLSFSSDSIYPTFWCRWTAGPRGKFWPCSSKCWKQASEVALVKWWRLGTTCGVGKAAGIHHKIELCCCIKIMKTNPHIILNPLRIKDFCQVYSVYSSFSKTEDLFFVGLCAWLVRMS